MGHQDDLRKIYICITKFKTQGRRKREAANVTFYNKININNKMKVSCSHFTTDSSAYVFACISQNPLNDQNAELFVQS